MVDGPDGAGGEPPALPGALPGTLQSILGRARVVITPYPFGVSDADNLRVVSVNAAAGITIEIHGRTAVGGFESKPFRFVHTPNSDRTAVTQDFVLGAGLVTNLSVFAAGGAPLIGQTFVIIQLVRSMGAVAYVMGTLLAGYVTATQGLGWPGSAIVSSTDGEPAIRYITGTDPAAGVDIVETVPTGARWELVSIACPIDFTSTVTALTPRMFIKSGGNLFAVANHQSLAGGAYANNMTFAWGAGLPYNVFGTFPTELGAGLPNGIRMPAGATIQIPALPNGNWQAPHYIVREWLEAA